MKKIKIRSLSFQLSFTLLALIMSNFIYGQYLSINPTEQSIAVDSGDQNSAYVTLYNQNIQYPINYKVTLFQGTSSDVNVNPSLNQNLSLTQNGFQNFVFTFSKNVTSNTTSIYKFKVTWTLQDGFNNEMTSYITINVTYLVPYCNLSPPINRFTGNILSNNAVASWDNVPGASAYYVKYTHDSGAGSPSNVITTDNQLRMYIFNPNSTHYWQVRTRCPNGSSGNWSDPIYFTTLSECPTNVDINRPITYNISEVKASGTITASSAINPDMPNLGNVSFAAQKIVLKPGFHAKGQMSGTTMKTFRAYVDPCTASKQQTESYVDEYLDEEYAEVSTKALPTLFPNPVSNLLNIENIEELNDWTLVDMYGKVINQGKTNPNQSKITINTSSLKPGIYYFNATLKNGELFQKTVMKK